MADLKGVRTLDALSHDLRGMADLVPQISERVEPLIERHIQDQFDAGEDSFGAPWAPLAEATLDKGRHPPPLTDTGTMLDSLRIEPTSSGFRVSMEGPSHFHQYGTSKMPARKILPESHLPETWVADIETIARALAGDG